jgi:hypothetical protein
MREFLNVIAVDLNATGIGINLSKAALKQY